MHSVANDGRNGMEHIVSFLDVVSAYIHSFQTITTITRYEVLTCMVVDGYTQT